MLKEYFASMLEGQLSTMMTGCVIKKEKQGDKIFLVVTRATDGHTCRVDIDKYFTGNQEHDCSKNLLNDIVGDIKEGLASADMEKTQSDIKSRLFIVVENVGERTEEEIDTYLFTNRILNLLFVIALRDCNGGYKIVTRDMACAFHIDAGTIVNDAHINTFQDAKINIDKLVTQGQFVSVSIKKEGGYGATSLMLPFVIPELSYQFLNSNCLVFPISVHEVVAVAVPDNVKGDYIEWVLLPFVRNYREKTIPEKEWLSDDVYLFERSKNGLVELANKL